MGPAHSPLSAPELDSAHVAIVEQSARASGLRIPVLRAALRGYREALHAGAVKRAVLTVIDYSMPSTEPRLWVLDLARGTVLARELVAHGRGSGDDVARRFSNREHSYASSLGTFVTGQTYDGKNGLSLRLDGLDPGVNDHAMERGIVVHGAWYVSQKMIRKVGRLGRSEGCPALSEQAAPRVIGMIEGGTVVYAYYPGGTPAAASPRG
jgi:L,D-transpeptidase catalytic domain